jgi:hypothetical protein
MKTVSPAHYFYCGGYLTAGRLPHQEPSALSLDPGRMQSGANIAGFAKGEFSNRVPMFAVNRPEP